MILRDLRLIRLPGIDTGFDLRPGPGLNLIIGPNGSGKTSICRAVSQLLWPRADVATPLSVAAVWNVDGTTMHSRCESNTPPEWQQNGSPTDPPDLPGEHLAACYQLGILDLLKREADRTDTDLATRIRTEMAGGFDMARIAHTCFSTGPRDGQSEARNFAQARAEVTRLWQQHDRLAEQEASLASLETQYDEFEKQADQLEFWKTAHRLALARINLAAAENVLGKFADELARVDGTERTLLAENRKTCEYENGQIQEHEQDLLEARKRLEAADLVAGPITAEQIQHWRLLLKTFRECHTSLASATTAAAGASARLEEAAAQIDPKWNTGHTTAISLPAIQAAGQYLRKHHRNTLYSESINTLIRHPKLATEPPEPTSDTLPQGISTLEQWLALPDDSSIRSRWISGLALAVATGAVGLFLAQANNQAWAWLLTGVGVGAAGVGISWFLVRSARESRAGQVRRMLLESYKESGLRQPATWKRSDVKQCRDWLVQQNRERELAELKVDLKEHLIAEKTLKEEELIDLQAQRSRLIDEFQADPEAGDLDVFVFAQRIQAYNAAHEAATATDTEVSHLEAEFARHQSAINSILDPQGEPGITTPDEFETAIARLEQHSEQFVAAQQTIAKKQKSLSTSRKRLAESQAVANSIFTRLDLQPDDDKGLDQLLQQYPKYCDAVQEHDRETRNVADRLAEVETVQSTADCPELNDRPVPSETSTRIERSKESQERLIELTTEITQIQSEVTRSRESRAGEDTLAERDSARNILVDRCVEIQERRIGAMLLEQVQTEYERATEPPVLATAKQLFESFTHGCYRLLVSAGNEGEDSFRVEDNRTHAGLGLRQLSDGTRAQLLLAARLAFIIEHEQSSKPPLLLDESLTSSDPERFAAIAAGLLSLSSREGRQIIYLTSNPADVQAWQRAAKSLELDAPEVIDLAGIRRDIIVDQQPDLDIPDLPATPGYEQQTPAAYGKEIAAHPLDAARSADEAHLFHLLRDDLALLNRLLRAHVSTVGQWRALTGVLVADGTIDQQHSKRLTLRCDVLDAVINNRRVGRGKRIDSEVLRASGCVSDSFLPEVIDLCTRTDGQAVALIDGLKAKKIRNFRKEKTAALERYLIREGYIDTRDILTREKTRQQVLFALRTQIGTENETDPTTVSHITRLFHELWTALEYSD